MSRYPDRPIQVSAATSASNPSATPTRRNSARSGAGESPGNTRLQVARGANARRGRGGSRKLILHPTGCTTYRRPAWGDQNSDLA